MTFMEFESMDQAFAWMADQTERANAVLTEEQRQITYGDCWIRFWTPSLNDIIVIFGKVMTREEVHESEHRGAVAPFDIAEADATTQRVFEQHERGYLFGWAYSVIEPLGEPGDTHRAHVWPIGTDLFEAVKAVGWDIHHADLHPQHRMQIETAYQAYRAFALSTAGQW